jgi:hypothetical protein
MQWRKLTNWREEPIWRGTVLRLLVSEWPYEAPVDFMPVASGWSPSGFSLLVSSGYKAGLFLLDLPASAKARGKVQAISRSWLVENWAKRVYAPCPVGQVRIIAGYPAGV